MTPAELTDRLKTEARRLGFDLAGACPATAPPGIERFRGWLAAGYAGRMRYLADRVAAYEHPCHVLHGARSMLVLGMNYRTAEPAWAGSGRGRVSRYAWGHDYHDLIRRRLRTLAKYHRSLSPGARIRGVVDTAPLLEKEFAQLAGLGWIGKNTLLLNRRLGSWFFLAALLTSEELACDPPRDQGHCGACRACLDACPTGALVAPYQLDARRCISYLTIELKDTIPPELQTDTGQWLFGCDICQEVCPWNRRTPQTVEEAFMPAADLDPAALAALLTLDDAAFRERFRHTPLWRPRRRGLLRNAAIALGNRPDDRATAALIYRLDDGDPVVCSACAWALGRYQTPEATAALRQRQSPELDHEVRREIEASLSSTQANSRQSS